MEKELNKELKKYKRKIKANLICNTKHSKKFMHEMSCSIDQYVEKNNIHQISEIFDHFGTPEEIAKSFLCETDISVISKKLRLKRVITISLIVALLIWSVCFALATKKSLDARVAYYTEEIEEIEVIED